MTIPANTPDELLLTVSCPPGAVGGMGEPYTKDTAAFELDVAATTRDDVTVVPEAED